MPVTARPSIRRSGAANPTAAAPTTAPFRLMDLAALPENREKGLMDVRITQWHEWHYTGESCPAISVYLIFTPWLVPYERFIPVRLNIADLSAKIEARANDEEVHWFLFIPLFIDD
ncbi:hypothetical protein B0H19DRAFT_1254233 [Mycena capillaripes]|nr:hypothetical protein B0H19DRAFT_1254233 [Mycena capillaripes]